MYGSGSFGEAGGFPVVLLVANRWTNSSTSGSRSGLSSTSPDDGPGRSGNTPFSAISWNPKSLISQSASRTPRTPRRRGAQSEHLNRPVENPPCNRVHSGTDESPRVHPSGHSVVMGRSIRPTPASARVCSTRRAFQPKDRRPGTPLPPEKLQRAVAYPHYQ